jgi:glucokinase
LGNYPAWQAGFAREQRHPEARSPVTDISLSRSSLSTGDSIATPSGLAVGVDIGGTKISAGIVTASGEVLRYERQPLLNVLDESSTTTIVDELVDSLLQDYPNVSGIGIGCAGFVEWPSGIVRYAANSAYRGYLIRDHVAGRTGMRTVIDNDANVAMWAEHCVGAAKGHRIAVGLTVGTGIGGGACLDGQILRGSSGLGLEIGHIVVDPRGPRCGCGNVGCLESRVSGTALARRAREAAAGAGGEHLIEIAGSPENVSGETVFAAASQGDKLALALYDEMGFWLGIGIACLVTLFDPTVVVLGGGMMAAGELLLRPTRESLAEHVYARSNRRLPSLCQAKAGSRAGVVGAALLAFDGAHSSR